jgi:hypothetical protein
VAAAIGSVAVLAASLAVLVPSIGQELRLVPDLPAARGGISAIAPLPRLDRLTAAARLGVLESFGGLVVNPPDAVALYHNGRVHERRGEPGEARRAYLAALAGGLDSIDLCLRLSAVLRVQDGRSQARATLADIARRHPGPAVEAALALTADGETRAAALAEVLRRHPDFAEGWYLLAVEHSEERLGLQTLVDKRAEYDAFARFIAFDDRLDHAFIDQSLLRQWRARAAERVALLRPLIEIGLAPRLTVTRTASGLAADIALPEAATGLGWSLNPDDRPTETGTTPDIDPRTGRPRPVTRVELPPAAPARIYVTYRDAQGHAVGPFAIDLPPPAR